MNVRILPFALVFVCVSIALPARAERNLVASPDGRIVASISTAGELTYSVAVDGTNTLLDSALGLRFRDGPDFGHDVTLVGSASDSVDRTWQNLYGKRRDVRDQFNECRFHFRERSSPGGKFDLVVRSYNDGVAFRYELPRQKGLHHFILEEERTQFAFATNCVCFAGHHPNGGFHGPHEWNYDRQTLADLKPGHVYGDPLLAQTPAAWIAITESDLRDWSALWLARSTNPAATGVTLLARLAPRLDGKGLVDAEAPHKSPWRVILIGAEPGRLVESDLVLNLATPCLLRDTSWIKPGKMAWDHWWSGETKMETATLEDYIQLASDMGWPYQMIDWKWYGTPDTNTADITRVTPDVNMPEVLRFAHDRGVREWAWLHWADVDRNDAYKRAFKLYEKWGLAGVKIDFMDRDDQDMVNWYEKITRAAAKHHLMVDFHGAFKPAGFNRTFPSQITREGVLGSEWNKWSRQDTPEHKLTLPFTRFLSGPADYTPGGFLNRQPAAFQIVATNAEVQGTRAAELALLVVFDSPIACLCDSPAHYRDQPGADFLKIVPTVWDETRVLDCMPAEHIATVRRNGGDWFLGAMTAGEARDIPIKLSFLGDGPWKMRLWKDAPDSAVNAEHLDTEDRSVASSETLTLHLAPNGGAVAHFYK